jgi:hypothetical protein
MPEAFHANAIVMVGSGVELGRRLGMRFRGCEGADERRRKMEMPGSASVT